MFHTHKVRFRVWTVPLGYAVTAIAAGLTLPHIEARLLPGFGLNTSVAAAMAMYSAIASGMIVLTGIVFSLAFVVVQFSTSAYSPRLVQWIARDPVISHALGVFTATFLYALAALAWVDRSDSGNVPTLSAWLVILLLMASVAMFVGLIQRIGLLQVNRMLAFTADQGRGVIDTMYPPISSVAANTGVNDFRRLELTQALVHKGRPQAIEAFDPDAMIDLAKRSEGVIEVVTAVGDTVVEFTPLLLVFGARRVIDEQKLRNSIRTGEARTFEQDPIYAIRLLVDIAIRALSPAVNDPTTAVQALDQIENLLLRLGNRRLEIGEYRDSDGILRLVIPFPSWEDLLRLSFTEIRFYGAESIQVMRRMRALISELTSVLPEERRATLKYWDQRVQRTIAATFEDAEDRSEASTKDRQGIGTSHRNPFDG